MKSEPPTTRGTGRPGLDRRSLTTLSILIGIALGFYAATYLHARNLGGMDPHLFLRPNNLANLLGQASLVGILACGMTLVIVAGQIDLSVGSLMGMLAAINACLLATDRGWNLGWPAGGGVACTLLLGGLLGAGQGAVVAFLRVPAFVVTLGGLLAFRGVLILLANQSIPIESPVIRTLGGGYLSVGTAALLVILAIGGILSSARSRARNDGLTGWRNYVKRLIFSSASVSGLLLAALVVWLYQGPGLAGGNPGLPVRCALLAVVAVLFHVVATRLRFGRHLFAIGGNSLAARYSGIAVERHLVGAFALMGICAALAGVINSGRLMAAGADAGDLMELYAIAACVIGGTSLAGGRGSILGSILGALIMATLRNGLSLLNVSNSVEKIVLGIILIVAVAMDLALARKSARS